MPVNQEIKFGTDGWRGIIAENYTFQNLKSVAQATADYLGAGKKAAVGFDTRFMSAGFARAAAQVLANNRIDVVLSDRPVPTPALSLAVRRRSLDLGVMITASHNPAEYNGYKIKVSSGGAAGPEVTAAVEGLLGKNQPKDAADGNGKVAVCDITGDYVAFIRSYIELKAIGNRRFKVLIDAMHGSGDSLIGEVLKKTKIRVEFMRNGINPSFGGRRPEPVEENLCELKARVKKEKFDLGIALDGDADRIAAVAPGGVFVHPQKILGLLALHLKQDRKFTGGIVKTICGTQMIDNIASFLALKLYETPVGFKYISNLMEKENILCGGEEAGGMGVKGYIPERDGSMAGLLLIEMMAARNQDMLKILNQAEKKFGKFYYLRRDLGLARPAKVSKEGMPDELLGQKVIEIKDYDGVKLICRDRSWLMLRASGTEPIMRIYSEAKSLRRAEGLLKKGEQLADAAVQNA